MPQFQVLQVDRTTGQLIARLRGATDGAPLAAIRSAAPPSIEIVDATVYAIAVTALPAIATVSVPFSFQVGWSQIGPTSDPFPSSPIAILVAGVSFTYVPDPTTHQATVSVTSAVVGPLTILVGGQSYNVEVS